MDQIKLKKVVFISGLHKSGTSFMANQIGSHDYVSMFSNTGFPMDEGQFVQSVMPLDGKYINPGRFAFCENAHLTEKSLLLQKKEQLIAEWSSHWDMSKPILLEKSPPNIIRTRFLQEVYPNAYFLTIIRHPIAVSYATKKWTNDKFLEILIRHWIRAHEIYFEDRKYLKNELLIRYEDFIYSQKETFDKIENFLNITLPNNIDFIDKNEFYFRLWDNKVFSGLKYGVKVLEKNYLIRKYERKINGFGYSLEEPGNYYAYYNKIKSINPS